MNRIKRRQQKQFQGKKGGTAPPSLHVKSLFEQARLYQQSGRLQEAKSLYNQILQEDPSHADSLHLLGLIAYRVGHYDRAIDLISQAIEKGGGKPHYYFNRGLVLQRKGQVSEAVEAYQKAVALKSDYFEALGNLGNAYRQIGELEKAAAAYKKALSVNPNFVDGYNNLGVSLKELGMFDKAASAYQQALAINPSHAEAHYNLGQVWVEKKELEKAMASFEAAIEAKPDYSKAHHSLGLAYLWKHRLDLALAFLRRSAEILQNYGQPVMVQTVYKSRLKHDVEQIQYLFDKGILNPQSIPYLNMLKQLNQRVNDSSDSSLQMIITPEERVHISPSFNRILHYAECSALKDGALNPALNVEDIQERYNRSQPEIIYVDSLLSEEALKNLRTFCCESTIWKKDYENGYIGAMLGEGFSSPLLLQITEELRVRFPRIFHDHQLVQAWAFKQDSQLKGLNIHADAAAVNVNFWITRNDANQDPSSGGLIVWDKEAPREWDFKVYNGTTYKPKIYEFLEESGAKAVTVPYRENRAVIFNSDLFHETDRCVFRDGYENRRM